MRAKLLILFLGLLGLFIAATAFRVDQIISNDKIAWNEAQARAQMGALSEALRADLNSAVSTMELAWPVISQAQKDYPKGRPYSRFHMIGELKKSGGDWSFENKFYLEGSSVRSWAANYSVLALKSLKDSQVPVGGSAVLALLDPSRKIYFLILTRTQSNWLAVVTGPEVFQGALDRQKGQVSTVFAVNSLGQALAHTVPEYVGSLLSEDPIVKEVVTAEAGAGSGTFQSAQGPVQGFFEQIPQTNVFVVVATPVNELLSGSKEMRWQMILLGLGFALVGAAALLLLLRGSGGSVARTETRVNTVPAKAPARETVSSAAKVDPNGAAQIRLQAYTKAAASLAHELRGPLLSLLGRARVLRESTHETETQKGLGQLEEGAREAFTTLHKLLAFSGEKEEPFVDTSLSEVLQRALRLMDDRFKSRGIQLESKIAEVPLIKAQPGLLVKAFEQILANAAESMDRGARKNLTVELSTSEAGYNIVIRDAGEGISPEDLEHIFDPFFTTKTAAGHSGLGLSLALGILRASGGELKVDSVRGQGTTVGVTFLPEQERAAEVPQMGFQSDSNAEAEQWVAIPSKPSVVPSAPEVVTTAPAVAAQPPPPPPPEEKAEMPEVLNDKLMERTLNMIDHLDDLNEPFQAPKAPSAPPVAPAASARSSAKEEKTLVLKNDSNSLAPDIGSSSDLSPEGAPSSETIPEAREESEQQEASEPPPAPAKHSSSGGHEEFMNFTAKIDKPKAAGSKKNSRLLTVDTEVRRPGDRS